MSAYVITVIRTQWLVGPRWAWNVYDPNTGRGFGGMTRTKRGAQRAALAVDFDADL
jgi:hypothetical protein